MSIEFKPFERETEEVLRLAVEAAQVGVWDYRIEADDLHWSDRCKTIFGLSEDADPSYQEVNRLIHAEDWPAVALARERAFDPSGDGLYKVEYRIRWPNGQVRWIASTGQVLFDWEADMRVARRFIGTVLDRTEQKLAQEALLRSENLASAGRLAASIAHEIRNPLNAVNNLLHLLRTEAATEPVLAYLDMAEAELQRVNEISTHTLHFYRDPIGSARVNVAELVATVLVLFQGRLRTRSIAVQKRLPPNVYVKISAGELRQVIVNLISNAIDATEAGGSIYVRVRSGSGSERAQIRITIADNGSGISASSMSRLFEPFFTTKGSDGNGIGLWMSREILKKHGADMQVRSKIGVGTVFRLIFSTVSS